jgi:hypothetical protein
MFCCYNSFHYLKLLKMIMSSFSGLSCVSVFSGIIRIYQYVSMSICQFLPSTVLYVLYMLFSTLSPVCSAREISIFLSSVSDAFSKLQRATISFIVVVRLSACPPVRLSACPPVCLLPVCLPACLPVRLSACSSVCLPACLPARLSACPPVCLSACLPARLSACPPVCLSACLPVRLSACPSVLLSTWNTMWLLLDESSWKLIFESFSKIYRESSSFIKMGQEKRYCIGEQITVLHWRANNGTALESK